MRPSEVPLVYLYPIIRAQNLLFHQDGGQAVDWEALVLHELSLLIIVDLGEEYALCQIPMLVEVACELLVFRKEFLTVLAPV